MAERSIVTEESKVIRKALKKWGEIPISNNQLNGVLKVKNYRRYQFRNEVDIIFEGKIFVTIRGESKGWHDSSILKHKGFCVSSVKLNRFFRRNLFQDVKFRMNYFGVYIDQWYYISKIKWI